MSNKYYYDLECGAAEGTVCILLFIFWKFSIFDEIFTNFKKSSTVASNLNIFCSDN